jgi:hypothetical protein
MVLARWVPPTNRAFLEMTLQDVAARERVFAQMALVGAFSRVWSRLAHFVYRINRHTSQQVPLQMLQVQICLVAMRALELVVCVLSRIRRRFPNSRSRPAWMGWQHSASSLLSYHMYWLRLLVSQHLGMRVRAKLAGETDAALAQVLQRTRRWSGG